MRGKDGQDKDREVRPGGRALERRRQFLEERGLLPEEDEGGADDGDEAAGDAGDGDEAKGDEEGGT